MKVGKIALSLLAAAILLALTLLPIDLFRFFYPTARLETYQAFTMFVVIPVAFIAIAVLLSLAVRLAQPAPSTEPHPAGSARRSSALHPTRPAVALLFLALLLLAKALQSLYWLLVWDNTYDPLGIFWLAIPVIGLAGILLAVLLKDGKDSPGCWFTFIGAALLIGIFVLAQLADSHQLTDVRSGRVSRALQRYYDQHGAYPQTLDEISSWVSPLPVPVRIFGQGWCYQSGPGYYRLGYLDREHWSDPRLIGRIARTGGHPPSDLPPLCSVEVAALQSQEPDYPYTYWRESR